MLFGLSVQGNAPKFLTRVSRRGVPVNSLFLSGAITSLVVLINYLLPKEAFGLLMALVVATLLLNWIMICTAHLRFRAAMRRKGRETQFKALLYPAGNYLCIAFLGLILVLMCTMDEMRLSAMLLPVWVVFLFIAFKLSRKSSAVFSLALWERDGVRAPDRTKPDRTTLPAFTPGGAALTGPTKYHSTFIVTLPIPFRSTGSLFCNRLLLSELFCNRLLFRVRLIMVSTESSERR